MASRVSATFSSAPPASFSEPYQNGVHHGQPLSETEHAQLGALLFPREGYRYVYQKVTPYSTIKLLDFTFDLKLFLQELSGQLAEKGLRIQKVCLAKEAARSILVRNGRLPIALDLEIQLEKSGSPEDVDHALLASLQKITSLSSGKPAAYEFFRDNGLKRPYRGGGAFTIPLPPQELNFKIFSRTANPCLFSTECFQIDATSLLLVRGAPPSASAAEGYDYHDALTLAMKGQFEILPERAAQLQHGIFDYVRLLTGRHQPMSLRAEAALWEGCVKEQLTGRLQLYLEEHYKNNARGALFFLLNFEDLIDRVARGEVKIAVREALAQRLGAEDSKNKDILLARCKVHLFLALSPEKLYFDESKDPLYLMGSEGKEAGLFFRFPLDSFVTVFAHWEQCRAHPSALEAEFPLAADRYLSLARARLASLRKTDYPASAETRELLAAVTGKEGVDVPRFLEGLLQKAKRLKHAQDRALLVDRELALYHHFRGGAPLTLERLKENTESGEEAMLEELALSEDPAHLAFAVGLAKRILKKKVAAPAIARLLQNPAVLHDPLSATLYQTLRSLGAEADDPAAYFSLFLLYGDPKIREEGPYLERLLKLKGGSFTAEERESLTRIALVLIPKLIELDLPLAHRLLEILTQGPVLVDEKCQKQLVEQVAAELLAAQDPNLFAKGKELLVRKVKEGALSPAASARCLKRVLHPGTKDAFARCTEVVEERAVFASLERECSLWYEYISRARTLDPTRAAAVFLEKEETLLQSLDFENYLNLLAGLSPEVQGNETRLIRLIPKLKRESDAEKKLRAVELFARTCTPAAAQHLFEILRGISIKSLKTAAGTAALARVLELLPQDQAFQALQFTSKHRIFSETQCCQYLKRFLEVGEEFWTEDHVEGLLTMIGEAPDFTEEQWMSVLPQLFKIPGKQLGSQAAREGAERVARPWLGSIAALQKKWGKRWPRAASFLAMQEIILCSSLAKKHLQLDRSADVSVLLNRAYLCFSNAVEGQQFCQVSHLRESFAPLGEAMLMHPEARIRVLASMKPYNFQGTDYLALIVQLERIYAESQDSRVLKQMILAGLYLFSHQDLVNSLTVDQTKTLIVLFYSVCTSQAQKMEGKDSGQAEAFIVKTLELLVLASQRTPAVAAYFGEHEEALVQVLGETFRKIAKMGKEHILSELAKSIEHIKRNSWTKEAHLLRRLEEGVDNLHPELKEDK